MHTIRQYPKLQLLVYDILKPYICIFDNEYLSFIDHCRKFKLLDFNKFSIVNSHDADTLDSERKKIRSFGEQLPGTQDALVFFKFFEDNIRKKAERCMKSKKRHNTREEEARMEQNVERLIR